MPRIRRFLTVSRLRFDQKRRHLARAWRYAWGRSAVNDAYDLLATAEDLTGYRCLEGLSESAALDLAIGHWGDRPELAALVKSACRRVASKWNSTGDVQSAAEDWALDLVAEWAAADGLVLEEIAA